MVYGRPKVTQVIYMKKQTEIEFLIAQLQMIRQKKQRLYGQIDKLNFKENMKKIRLNALK